MANLAVTYRFIKFSCDGITLCVISTPQKGMVFGITFCVISTSKNGNIDKSSFFHFILGCELQYSTINFLCGSICHFLFSISIKSYLPFLITKPSDNFMKFKVVPHRFVISRKKPSRAEYYARRDTRISDIRTYV